MNHKRDAKSLIKENALVLFNTRGLEQTSVRDIMHAASMSPANLYSHYNSKDSLVDELFNEICHDYGARVSQVLLAEFPFLEKVSHLVDLVCTLYDDDNLRFCFLLILEEPRLIANHDAVNPLEILRAAIDTAMAHHEIGRDDPGIVAVAMVGVLLEAAAFVRHGRLSEKLQTHSLALSRQCYRLIPPLDELSCQAARGDDTATVELMMPV